jgi:drug/metabolite transporter (DMT)-like permease
VSVMKRSVWLVFGVYCLLSSAGWIIAPFGEGGNFYLNQTILYFAIGCGTLLIAGRRLWVQSNRGPWVKLAVAGIVFFGAPACLIRWAGSGVNSILGAASFALLPAVVVLVIVIGWGEDGGWGSLVPALAGFGGVLLLLPAVLPGSVRGQLMLAVVFVAVVLAAVSGVWLHRRMQGVAVTEAVAIVCFANAMFLMICGWVARTSLWNRHNLVEILSLSTCANLMQIVLGFWLLREMSPVRFATRYLMIPLLTIVEGYIVLRPEITTRMMVGTVLLAGGTTWILLSKEIDDEAILSLR